MKDAYHHTLKYIYAQLPMFHRIGAAAYKDNLDNTLALSKLTCRPERRFTTIHIAGTNGKGSVSNMLASILQEAGYKTGLFTSPHLKDFRERIRVNGEMIPKKEVVRFIEKYKNDFETIQPSFFEMTFAMAMKHFEKSKIEVAVVETGMGGRLDSTNIISPLLCIITNISYDHMQFLGCTLPKIAAEKAGIIKPNVPVIIGKTQHESKDVFMKFAAEAHSPIYFADNIYQVCDFSFSYCKPYGSVFTIAKEGRKREKLFISPLSGNYQKENLQTVFMAAFMLKDHFTISDEAFFDGIANVSLNTGFMGRWQVLKRNPLTICDAAHNEAGIAAVLQQIAAMKVEKLHFVIGMVNDKDINNILKLLPGRATYYFCKPNIPRGLDQEILAKKAGNFGLKGNSYASVKVALKAARTAAHNSDLVFIGGSSFVVAEVV